MIVSIETKVLDAEGNDVILSLSQDSYADNVVSMLIGGEQFSMDWADNLKPICEIMLSAFRGDSLLSVEQAQEGR